ncbi:MAG: LamG-like jellyroll fold domain-containing protein [Bacteroidota bacterium]
MKRLVLITFFNLFLIVAYGQVYSWGRSVGSTGADYARSVFVDGSGSVYTVGQFTGTVDFDPGAGVQNLTSTAGADVFIQKLNSAGNYVFVKRVGGAGDDIAYDVAVDANGIIYVTGSFEVTVDFDPGAGANNRTSAGGLDAFLLKLTSTGNWSSSAQFGSTGTDIGLSVCANTGAVAVTGTFQNVVDFDPGIGSTTLDAFGTTAGFVARLTTGMSFTFAKYLGGGGNASQMDASGNVYAAGILGPVAEVAGVGHTLNAIGSTDIFVCKLSAAGTNLWSKVLGGASGDGGFGVNIDASFNVYTTGYFSGTGDFDPGAGTASLTSGGSNDIFVSKLDASGNYVWASSFSGTGDDRGTAIDIDAAGNVYTAGYFRNTVDFDPGVGTDNLISAGLIDGFLSKLNASGQQVWAKSVGSTGNDALLDVAVDATTNIHMAGYYTGTVDVDPTAATVNLTSLGVADIMVLKWSPCAIPTAPTNTTALSNLTICGLSGSTTLSGSGTGTLGWYTAASGGTYLGSGSSYTTGTISATTTYYLQDSSCVAGARTAITVSLSPLPVDQLVNPTTATICSGGNSTITINNTETNVFYSLIDDVTDAVVMGPILGTGSSLNFNLTGITATTTYHVTAEKPTSINRTLILDGVNDLVNLGTGNRGVTSTVTVSLRMKTSVTPAANQYVMSKYNGTAGITMYIDNQGKIAFYGRDGGVVRSSGLSTTTVTDNQWHDITGVVRSTGWEIYIDGVLENSGAYSLGTGITNASNFNIGNYTTSYSPIEIDKATIWNTALSPAQIAANVTACLAGNEPNLTGYFKFDEGTGAIATDFSPPAINGVLTNMTVPSCWNVGPFNECTITCDLELSQLSTINVTSAPSQPTISASGSTMLCSGGSVTLTSSAGTSYLWSNGATTAAITVSTAGTYTVQVTNASGCQSVASAGTTVIVGTLPSQPTISAGGATTFCAGGSVTLTSSAGTSYLWSNGATTAAISPTTSGTYTVQVTNASGCQSVASSGTTVTVNTAPAQPTISAGGPTTFCAGGSVTLTSSAGTSYLWSNGATTAAISPTTAGTYTVQVTNAGGCQSVASTGTAVTVNALPSQPTISAGGATTFCAGGSVTLTSSAGTSYLWSTGATTAAISPTTAGTYTVQVTNAAGCQSTASAGTAVTVNALPSQPTISAGGATTFCAGGSVTLTSSAGTSYLWSNGATTAAISPATAGTYTVQVTNAAGCQSTASTGTTVTVNALPSQPTISAGGATTFCAGGSVTLTSSAGTSYLWSNGATTAAISPTTAGTYTVQVTNPAGCQSTASAETAVTVNTLPSQPTISASGATTFCEGGSVTLTSSAGTVYLWSTGATTAAISPTTAGTYTVQVTNAAGCQSTVSTGTTITVNALPVIAQGTVTNPTSCTIDNGSVEITGTETGDLSWTGTSSGSLAGVTLPATISGLSDGSFNITFTNTLGCASNIINSSLTAPSAPAAPTITASGATTFCAGGSVTLTSSTGTAYLWSNGETTPSIEVSDAGSYTVSITDASGCSSTASSGTTVALNALPVIGTGTVTNPSSCTIDNGSIEVTGTGTGDVFWTGTSGGSLTAITLPATINSLGDGTYDITFTDALGCTSTPITSSLTLPGTPGAPIISASGAINFCEGGSVTLTSSTGTSYLWSNGETTPSIEVDADGTFTVIITDADGCTSPSSTTTTVAVDQMPDVTVTEVNNTITATQTGAAYQWIDCGNGNQEIPGATNITFSPTANGSYAVIITTGTCSDTSACTTISTIGLNEQELIHIGLHPNPSFDVVQVTASGEIQYIEIFAATGELIRIEYNALFDIREMARGIYLVKVTTDQGTGTVRLVKE